MIDSSKRKTHSAFDICGGSKVEGKMKSNSDLLRKAGKD